MNPFVLMIAAMLAVAFWRHVVALILVGVLILTMVALISVTEIVQTGTPVSLGSIVAAA